MLQLNLEALGVTEAALEETILGQLGMTREQAVKALAEKFGVDLTAAPIKATPIVVSPGDVVQTSQGEAKAIFLTGADAESIAKAGNAIGRLFE